MKDFSLELTLGADEQKRALVIEDNKDTARDFAKRLQTFGFDCDTAYDGMSALRKLRTVEYEVAIVDIKLPDISGLELLNIIRSEEKFYQGLSPRFPEFYQGLSPRFLFLR